MTMPVRHMAAESGIETPSGDELARMDRARKGKKLSNADWDSEAKIAKMKDGTTHLAYKPEHAVEGNGRARAARGPGSAREYARRVRAAQAERRAQAARRKMGGATCTPRRTEDGRFLWLMRR